MSKDMTGRADHKRASKAPLSLWKPIVLVIGFTFVVVGLFGVIIFLFISGAQRLGLSTAGYVAIFVIVSGIFAWVVNRLSDTASSLSHWWFSEEPHEQD